MHQCIMRWVFSKQKFEGRDDLPELIRDFTVKSTKLILVVV